MFNLAVIVCAAGAAQRFGAPKLLAPYGGESLLARSYRLCAEQNLTQLVTVTGFHVEAYRPHLSKRTVENPHPGRGLSSSLQVGLTYVKSTFPEANAVLVILPDLIFSAATLAQICQQYQVDPAVPIGCRYPDCEAPPSVLPSALWPEIMALEGDKGALKALKLAPTHWIECDIYLDIDTPELHAAATATTPVLR